MKTGEAFAAFIEWDLNELLKVDHISGDDIYNYIDGLNELVENCLKDSAPTRVDWIMDAHRIIWFKTDRKEQKFAARILLSLYSMLAKVRQYGDKMCKNKLPTVSFRIGLGVGKVAMHLVDRNAVFGDGLDNANACVEAARSGASLIVANTLVFGSLPSVLQSANCGETGMIALDEQQFETVAIALSKEVLK